LGFTLGCSKGFELFVRTWPELVGLENVDEKAGMGLKKITHRTR